MKKILMGAAAALAVAMPGVASADTAEVGFHFGNIEPDGGSDADIYGLDGGYSHAFSNGWTLQLDGQVDRLDVGGDLGSSYGAVNLGMRNDSHSFYGFVGMSDAFALSFTNIGVGGQLYLGQATINGSIGYSDADAGVNVTNARVDGTWFLNDNFGLTAEAGWAEAEAGGDIDWTTLGVGGAWRFAGTGFTLNGGYQNIDADGGEADVWRLGLTYHIGTASERERSQSGASWNGARRTYEDTLVVFF
jgi:hypothetical protein